MAVKSGGQIYKEPCRRRIASSTPAPTLRELSEMAKHSSLTPQGSTSPHFIPAVTVVPSGSRPRSTPPMAAVMGISPTVARICPAETLSPMTLRQRMTPA